MRRPRTVLPVPLLALALLTGGCAPFASDDGPQARQASASQEPSAEDSACREKWRDLAGEVEERADDEHPSSLAGRWTSVAASLDYYAVNASASDCEKTLPAQEKQVGELDDFIDSIREHDVLWQHDRLEERATAYAPPKDGRKGSEPPSQASVRKALRTMEQRAERAEKDQQPGWQQATVVELDDAKAVRKARKDLAFLSEESAAWRAADEAQRTIERALRAERG